MTSPSSPSSSSNDGHEPKSPRATAGSRRIPPALQAVFLASNRGQEVHQPPPEGVASKLFLHQFVTKKSTSSCLSPNNMRRKVCGSSSSLSGSSSKSMTLLTEEEESSSSCSRFTELLPEQPPRREHRRRRSSTSNSSSSLTNTTTTSLPSLSPKDYLDAMLYSRGYSTQCYSTLDTAYFNQPTPLQRASYDLHLLELVRQGQVEAVRDLIEAGVSPNACNAHGESLLHMVCRRGNAPLLRLLLDLGGSLHISDDYGRTPLHDACWTARPNFEIVKALLQVDRHLLHLMDCRGAVPLSYVRKEHWAAWLEFFASHKDVFWPKRDLARRSCSTRTSVVQAEKDEDPPELTRLPPNSRPLKEPKSSLTPDLAALVAQGRITPLEAKFLFFDQSESGEGVLLEDDDDDEDETEDDDDDDDDDLDQSLSDLLASCWGLTLEDDQADMTSKLKVASSKSLATTAARLAVVSPAVVLKEESRGP